MSTLPRIALPLALTAASLVACKADRPKDLAPPAESLAPAQPATAMSRKFQVTPTPNAVTWVMNAPLEKIYGDVPGGASGELFIDLMDITKTTGLITVNIATLELYQQKRDDETKEYGAKEKNPLQNEHARAWLEISPDTPEEMRRKNEVVEFKLKTVTASGAVDVTKLAGDKRVVRATITGDFVLHGHQTTKTADIEVTFDFTGAEPTAVRVRTLKPLVVGLEEHDVRPREAFGKLAAKTLAALGNKVASEAPIDLDLTARAMP
jgi:hypothetical protein